MYFTVFLLHLDYWQVEKSRKHPAILLPNRSQLDQQIAKNSIHFTVSNISHEKMSDNKPLNFSTGNFMKENKTEPESSSPAL